MKEECKRESNDFLKLVKSKEFKGALDEEDLKFFLEKRMDMIESIYGWLVPAIIAALASLIAVHYFALLGITLEASVAVAVAAVFIAATYYVHHRVGSILPLVAQRKTMEQYLCAKAELRGKKISSDE